MKYKHECQWCGVGTNEAKGCYACRKKLELIRHIKQQGELIKIKEAERVAREAEKAVSDSSGG